MSWLVLESSFVNVQSLQIQETCYQQPNQNANRMENGNRKWHQHLHHELRSIVIFAAFFRWINSVLVLESKIHSLLLFLFTVSDFLHSFKLLSRKKMDWNVLESSRLFVLWIRVRNKTISMQKLLSWIIIVGSERTLNSLVIVFA